MPGRRVALCVAVSIMLITAGCGSPSRVSYIPDGGAYSADDLLGALQDAAPGATADVTAEEAGEVRQEALADLRTHGEEAAALADTLTAEFPIDVAAVPFAVELGTFEGEAAWIVFEAWGEPGERLSFRRAWVFSYDDHAVLAAESSR